MANQVGHSRPHVFRSPPIERSLFQFIWKYSKREQIVLLLVTACLFPLLYLTLELPKRIVNDAIGAQSSTVELWGRSFDQLTYLWILCGAFLLAVLAHGLTKMRINTMKGVLAERMLRRFRYSLIARILRFPQPYFERTSQGELVSMITSESEPMGGLMGDAVSQPVLQAGQMLTILYFLFLQNFWFGLAAIALIPVQAWLIPVLQRRINKLNKKRVVQVRGLASEIGESAAGAATLRVNGGWRYRMARVTDRLGRLYEIRFEIYQKKFFMKFLNNFITQLTPFFFYAVGGYLVLEGKVSLGALVAALAAYKDLASPWKELLTYYNQTQDMALRWEVILERFAPPDMVDERLMEGEPEELVHLDGDIVLDGVSVRDSDGNLVLDEITATFPKGELIGIAAPSEEDRRALAEVLTREVLPAAGTVTLASHNIRDLHQMVLASRIGHATSRPVLFRGSFGENVLMPLRMRPMEDPADLKLQQDAVRAGNSPDAFGVNWVDPKVAGFEHADELRDWWLRIVQGIGSDTALLRRGMDQVFDKSEHPKLAEALVKLRPHVQLALMEAGLDAFVHINNRHQYNPALPVAENLLYATRSVPITYELLLEQTEFLRTVRRIGLDRDLVNLAQDVLEMLRQIFGMDGTTHPLFRKLGLETSDYEAALQLLQKIKQKGPEGLEPHELAQMMIVPFSISAEALGPAFDTDIENRILSLRDSHGAELLSTLDDIFVPLYEGHYAPGFTVLENAIFGKISDSAGPRAEDLRKVVAEVIDKAKVREMVVELIFDLPVSVGGAGLGASFAEPLAFCRASIKRPDILILDSALASFDRDTRRAMQDNLRQLLPETTLIFLEPAFREPGRFDHYFELRQGRLKDEGAGDRAQTDEDSTSAADLSRKLRALETTELFSGLNRRQLRLLAFGARWYEASPGTAVFHKDDAATDGAYMIIEGEAGLYLPAEQSGGEDQLIATVGPGRLVGELGLIRKEPRALSMIAETDLTCLRIGEEEFLAVVENDANTAFKLLQVVAGYVSS
ncbi:ABC transporter transmembrane domain-containing protein [Tritonibacter horizontis]|uniref:Putative multidrug resistance ABC transporter ATP-binding/permease protein YheH n=1 Tax=Tritonibacter horizontis TaxID=1768241 RepID=A0A132BS99_9RHOB|nr:ABC transporter transmembrane domain-containing protein [Tritonibacter horizontis]KUP91086.1 putative multidrug resistance ABC transporter ATP-binding/permease protein YheH [Tritonibacter horizontis]